MSKHKYFVTFLKKINLLINSLLKKNLNKLNLSNLSNIALSNKFFLTFVALVALFLSYLSIPHIYDKNEIKLELENQLQDQFSLNFIFSNKFKYKFFPRPHFIIEDSSIIENKVKVSDIKKLLIFVSLDNLFSLNNLKIRDVILENSNFNLNKKNANFFINLLDKNYIKSSFKIIDSNIFFQNSKKEVLFINKIIDMKYYYDPKELKNIIISKNELFNIPYSFTSYKGDTLNQLFSKINFDSFKLQIQNKFYYDDNKKEGEINFIYNKNKSKAIYKIDKEYFNFSFFDRLNNSKFIYEGNINFKPFYSILKGNIYEMNITNLFNSNSLFSQILKTEILNNKNLNLNLNINAKKAQQYKNFLNIFFNLKIEEGLIDLDGTKFNWDNNVNFKIQDSALYIVENQLIFDGKLFTNIKNYNDIYKFIQMPRDSRPKLKNLEFYFNYNLDQQILNLDVITINDQVSEEDNKFFKDIMFKKNALQNKIYFKNLMKKAINAYLG